MNAHTPFRLEAPAVTDLSRLDLSDAENVKNAAHQLRRCVTPGDFELWAKQWGEGLCQAAETHAAHGGDDFVPAADVKEIEDERDDAAARAGKLEDAVEAACKALDRLPVPDGEDRLIDAIGAITNALEAALDA
jgi:hypothetical protein